MYIFCHVLVSTSRLHGLERLSKPRQYLLQSLHDRDHPLRLNFTVRLHVSSYACLSNNKHHFPRYSIRSAIFNSQPFCNGTPTWNRCCCLVVRLWREHAETDTTISRQDGESKKDIHNTYTWQVLKASNYERNALTKVSRAGDHIFGILPFMAGRLNGAGGVIPGVTDPRTYKIDRFNAEPALEIYGPLGTRAYVRSGLAYTHVRLARQSSYPIPLSLKLTS